MTVGSKVREVNNIKKCTKVWIFQLISLILLRNTRFCIMGNKIQLSVVIPVYNTEKYLQRCVDSVLENRSIDMEIIQIGRASCRERV